MGSIQAGPFDWTETLPVKAGAGSITLSLHLKSTQQTEVDGKISMTTNEGTLLLDSGIAICFGKDG